MEEEKRAKERMEVASAQAQQVATLRQNLASAQSENSGLKAELEANRAELADVKTVLHGDLESTRSELVEVATAKSAAHAEWSRGRDEMQEMHGQRVQEERTQAKEQAAAMAAVEKSGALATLQTELESLKGALARAESERVSLTESWAVERRELTSSFEWQHEAHVAASQSALGTSATEEETRVGMVRGQAGEMASRLREQIEKLRASLSQAVTEKQAASVAWSVERAELVNAHERRLIEEGLRTDQLIDSVRQQSEVRLAELAEHIKESMQRASEVTGALQEQVQQTRQDLTHSMVDRETVNADLGKQLSEQMKAYSLQAMEVTDALRSQLVNERKELARLVSEKESIQIAWANERAALADTHERHLLEQATEMDGLLRSAREDSEARLSRALSMTVQQDMSSPRTPSKQINQLRQQLAEAVAVRESGLLEWTREKQALTASFEQRLEEEAMRADELVQVARKSSTTSGLDLAVGSPASPRRDVHAREYAESDLAEMRGSPSRPADQASRVEEDLAEMHARVLEVEAQLSQEVTENANLKAYKLASKDLLEVAEEEAEQQQLALEEYMTEEERRADERMKAAEAQGQIAEGLRVELAAVQVQLAEAISAGSAAAEALRSQPASTAAQDTVAPTSSLAQSTFTQPTSTETAMVTEAQALRGENTQLRLELASTKAELVHTQQMRDAQAKAVASLETELESTRMRLADVSSSLHSDLEATRAQLMRVQNSQHIELESTRERLAQMRASQQDLDASFNSAVDMEPSLNGSPGSQREELALTERAGEAQAQMISTLRIQLDKSRADLSDLSVTMRGDLQSSTSELMQAQSDKDAQAHELSMAKVELQAAQASVKKQAEAVAALRAELESERARLAQVSSELRGKLSSAKSELVQAQNVTEVQVQSVSSLRSDLESTRSRLAEVSSALHGDLVSTQSELMQVQSAKDAHEHSVTMVRAELVQARSNQVKSTETIAALRSELETAREEMNQVSSELRGDLASSQSRLAYAEGDVRSQTASATKLRVELETTRSELASVRSTLQGHLDAAQQELVETQRANDKVQEKWQAARDEMARRMQQEKATSSQALKERTAELEAQNVERQRAAGSFIQASEALESANQALITRLRAAEALHADESGKQAQELASRAAAQAQAVARITELEEAQRHSAARAQALQTQLSEQTARFEAELASKVDQASAMSSAARAECEALTEQLRVLSEQLSSAAAGNDGLQAENTMLTAQLHVLREQLQTQAAGGGGVAQEQQKQIAQLQSAMAVQSATSAAEKQGLVSQLDGNATAIAEMTAEWEQRTREQEGSIWQLTAQLQQAEDGRSFPSFEPEPEPEPEPSPDTSAAMTHAAELEAANVGLRAQVEGLELAMEQTMREQLDRAAAPTAMPSPVPWQSFTDSPSEGVPPGGGGSIASSAAELENEALKGQLEKMKRNLAEAEDTARSRQELYAQREKQAIARYLRDPIDIHPFILCLFDHCWGCSVANPT